MNYAEAISDISERISVSWPYHIVWDNVDWCDKNHNEPWALVTIKHSYGGVAAIGNRLYDQGGVVFVYIHALAGLGLAPFPDLIEIVKKAFRETGSGKVWYRNVRVNETGVIDRWFQVIVSAEFVYYEVI